MAAALSDLAMKEREVEGENGLASVRMEGLEPSDEAKSLFQRYVDGEVTAEEFDRSFERLLTREY